jgi:hypothetical protein
MPITRSINSQIATGISGRKGNVRGRTDDLAGSANAQGSAGTTGVDCSHRPVHTAARVAEHCQTSRTGADADDASASRY